MVGCRQNDLSKEKTRLWGNYSHLEDEEPSPERERVSHPHWRLALDTSAWSNSICSSALLGSVVWMNIAGWFASHAKNERSNCLDIQRRLPCCQKTALPISAVQWSSNTGGMWKTPESCLQLDRTGEKVLKLGKLGTEAEQWLGLTGMVFVTRVDVR